ncbi:AAA family ATPase [Rhodococcus sp. As11]|uniref:AAA family ATPase n=1 Tax=Rhodococcus sp. As11 TaxID=3029189 RepID=UPI003B82C0EE
MSVDPYLDVPPFDDSSHSLLASRLRSGAWLDAQQFPPLNWAIDGVIPEGFGLIVAPPKAGKSWFVLGAALAKADGGRALGCISVRRGPVLYLALEDGYRRLQSRCRILLGDSVPIPGQLDVIIDAQAHEVPMLVGEWLEQHRHDAPLVVLDTLGKVMPPKAAGESDYQRDYRVAGKLKALADAVPGSTVLAVHHTRKAESSDFVDAVSGTQGIAGAADFILVLARKRHDDQASLAVTGRDVIEAEYAITSRDGAWTLDGGSLKAAAAALAERKSTDGIGDRSAEIIRYVSGYPGGVSPKEVADALGIPDARRYLARLADAERLRKIGRGLYGPPSTPVPTVPLSQSEDEKDELEGEWDNGTVGTAPGQGDNTARCVVCGQPFLFPAAGKTICSIRDEAHDNARGGDR